LHTFLKWIALTKNPLRAICEAAYSDLTIKRRNTNSTGKNRTRTSWSFAWNTASSRGIPPFLSAAKLILMEY